MQTKFRLVCLILATLISSLFIRAAFANQVVYFWYDENGVIHFAEQRPSDRQVYAVEMLEAPTEKKENKYTYESLFEDKEKAAKEAEAEKEQPKYDMTHAKQRCEDAKKTLWILEHKNFVRQQGRDGEISTLSYEQKLEITARSQEEISNFCK
ncbi:DUF4124 domain-containing protein [Corallincola platygyrae]|uniref:DUF4124 domain-containing protein n=1 Tax=Corallincola platygyrae TaxID=1193278 RepID=A0ABW4XTV3_9GAMM